MYLLFRDKGWEPGRYWNLPAGEKALVRSFYLREQRQREEARRS